MLRRVTDWLNYHHLHYFWVVATEGGITAASRKLRIAPSTLSAQIQQLEEASGNQLFHRGGRRLVLTEVGRLTKEYADEIFDLGQELFDVLQGRSSQRYTQRLNVGLTNGIPKLVAVRLLEPVLHTTPAQHLVCKEDRLDVLMAELAIHHLDVIIADTPVSRDGGVRLFNHELGKSSVTFFAMPELADALRPGFPQSLNDAPTLLPYPGSNLRRLLGDWFLEHRLRPRVLGELDDSGLMKELGATGLATFPVASVVADTVIRQYGAQPVGEIDGVHERFYVVSTERKLRHPGVVALVDAAREDIF